MLPNWRELVEASSGDVRRLSSVWRFSSIPVVTAENTAEHSYWVALYSAMIHKSLWEDRAGDLIGRVLVHALAHDLAECVTGDVVRVFKYSTPELKKEVDRAEGILYQGLPKIIRDLEPDLDSKEGAYVKDVVKCADFLSLFQYMRREAMRGNHEIAPFFVRMVEDLGAAAKSDKVHSFPNVEFEFEPAGLYATMEAESKKLLSIYLQPSGRIF